MTTTEIAGSASENFNQDQLKTFETAARHGDPHAQALVESYYMRIGDWLHYEEWLEIGAAEKDPAAMQRLSAHLARMGGDSNCDRAVLLLNQARELTPANNAALRNVIDTDLLLLQGKVEGAPPCANRR